MFNECRRDCTCSCHGTVETVAEHIGNGLAILQLTGTRVIDRADDGSVVIVPLSDWEAALARFHRALLQARFEEATRNDPVARATTGRPSANPDIVSGDTRRIPRNTTSRQRQADLDSARDAERLRAFYGPQLS